MQKWDEEGERGGGRAAHVDRFKNSGLAFDSKNKKAQGN